MWWAGRSTRHLSRSHRRCRKSLPARQGLWPHGEKRMAAAPNIPTMAEAGLPAFYFSYWSGLFAPRARPSRHRGPRCRGRRGDARPAATRKKLDAQAFVARASDQQTPGAGGAAASRDREMVADHQASQHQGRLRLRLLRRRSPRRPATATLLCRKARPLARRMRSWLRALVRPRRCAAPVAALRLRARAG